MASFGKKILSAFLEVGDEKKEPAGAEYPGKAESAAAGIVGAASAAAGIAADPVRAAGGDRRFLEYFDKLLSEANIPGPDYYEFATMIAAMRAIADERSRFTAAFAGLQVQGLDKEKLLATAGEYLRVLTADADRFDKTVEATLQEKVHSRSAEAGEKGRRIQALSQEVLELQTQITAMQQEISEAKEKLEANSNAYATESEKRRQQIQSDIGKINNYIH
jgi:hypothetical protein